VEKKTIVHPIPLDYLDMDPLAPLLQ